MVKMTIEEIKSIIRPCGLSPMKSKGILGLSKILIEEYEGQVPQNMEALEKLPAVGHKTASVVVSQAFGQPAFPVDTHNTMCLVMNVVAKMQYLSTLMGLQNVLVVTNFIQTMRET